MLVTGLREKRQAVLIGPFSQTLIRRNCPVPARSPERVLWGLVPPRGHWCCTGTRIGVLRLLEPPYTWDLPRPRSHSSDSTGIHLQPHEPIKKSLCENIFITNDFLDILLYSLCRVDLFLLKKIITWGAWVALSVNHPALEFSLGHDLRVLG